MTAEPIIRAATIEKAAGRGQAMSSPDTHQAIMLMNDSAQLAARIIGAWTSGTLTTASARRLLDRTRKLSDEAASISAARRT